MRYDDEQRPHNSGQPVQLNGSAIPCVTLIRLMESETDVEWFCNHVPRCAYEDAHGGMKYIVPSADCPSCTRSARKVWGWLASIHAHIEGNRFGSFTGFIADLAAFHEAFMESPEDALAHYFQYTGSDKRATSAANATRNKVVQVVDAATLWED